MKKFLGILWQSYAVSNQLFYLCISRYHSKVFGLANSSSLATRSRFKTWEGEISQGMSGSQIFLSL
jgi:hypothetical protein